MLQKSNVTNAFLESIESFGKQIQLMRSLRIYDQ